VDIEPCRWKRMIGQGCLPNKKNHYALRIGFRSDKFKQSSQKRLDSINRR